MNERAVYMTVGLLLVAVCVLGYLEWWRAGELSTLHERIVRLEHPPKRSAAPRTREGKPERPVAHPADGGAPS